MACCGWMSGEFYLFCGDTLTGTMITRERLKGAYSEGEALAIYSEARAGGDLAGFCRQYMHDED